uniref:Gag/pol protein n=1 Tax=Cucumis melo TaxID=3656 RepID=A0A9I9E6X0_CUCME
MIRWLRLKVLKLTVLKLTVYGTPATWRSMNNSIVQLLAFEKCDGDNYVTWNSNLNIILVINDLRFFLTEERPQAPTSNANQNVREAYYRWVKANEKACVYILASMSDVLARKHGSLATTKEIMDSLREMFGQSLWSFRNEAIKYIYTKQMKEGTSVREHVIDMMKHFNIAEVIVDPIDEANQNLTMGKRKEVETNVATIEKEIRILPTDKNRQEKNVGRKMSSPTSFCKSQNRKRRKKREIERDREKEKRSLLCSLSLAVVPLSPLLILIEIEIVIEFEFEFVILNEFVAVVLKYLRGFVVEIYFGYPTVMVACKDDGRDRPYHKKRNICLFHWYILNNVDEISEDRTYASRSFDFTGYFKRHLRLICQQVQRTSENCIEDINEHFLNGLETRPNVNPDVVERSVVHHVVDDFINNDNEQLSHHCESKVLCHYSRAILRRQMLYFLSSTMSSITQEDHPLWVTLQAHANPPHRLVGRLGRLALLCDLYLSRAFQEQSRMNNATRQKQPYNHSSESKLFLQRQHELAEEQGQPVGHVQLFRETHARSGQFILQAAADAYLRTTCERLTYQSWFYQMDINIFIVRGEQLRDFSGMTR